MRHAAAHACSLCSSHWIMAPFTPEAGLRDVPPVPEEHRVQIGLPDRGRRVVHVGQQSTVETRRQGRVDCQPRSR